MQDLQKEQMMPAGSVVALSLLQQLHKVDGLRGVISYSCQREEAGFHLDSASAMTFAVLNAHLIIQDRRTIILVERLHQDYRVFFKSWTQRGYAEFSLNDPLLFGYRRGVNRVCLAVEAYNLIYFLNQAPAWYAGIASSNDFLAFQDYLSCHISELKRYFEFLVY